MIYLHVPFCRSFCTYCGFHSRICSGAESQQVQNFIRRVLSEIDARREEILAARASSVHTLYLGGGTPSLLSIPQLGQIVSALTMVAGKNISRDCQKNANSENVLSCSSAVIPSEFSAVIPSEAKESSLSFRAEHSGVEKTLFEEFTVEVNPDDIAPAVIPSEAKESIPGLEYVRGLRALGVNRVSMGVQSWDDGILRWMNRRHDAATARRAFRTLRDGGIENISLDLIFGLSQLSDEVWAETLRETVSLRPEHISAYQLSIEPDSTLAREVRAGRYREASDEAAARQYAMLCDALAAAGYVHYEVSNFAFPGREAVHNSAYWRRLPYVGLGPAAHSFDGTRRSWNNVRADWLSPSPHPGLEPSPHPGPEPSRHSRLDRESENCETLTEAEAREEAIMLGLRTAAGIPAALLAASPAAERLLAEGALVRLPGGRLRIPESHFFVSDDIISSLL